jgi:hypothetical protein
MRPDAERATDDLRTHLEGIVRAAEAYFAVERRASALLEPLNGLDAQDLPRSDRIAELRRFASRQLGEPLPLPRSLVDQPGYPSLKVQVPGGWVRPQNVRANEVPA